MVSCRFLVTLVSTVTIIRILNALMFWNLRQRIWSPMSTRCRFCSVRRFLLHITLTER